MVRAVGELQSEEEEDLKHSASVRTGGEGGWGGGARKRLRIKTKRTIVGEVEVRTFSYMKGDEGGLKRKTQRSLIRILQQYPPLNVLPVGEENLWTKSVDNVSFTCEQEVKHVTFVCLFVCFLFHLLMFPLLADKETV